jgi:uncharacterized MnhB-related membrane protein
MNHKRGFIKAILLIVIALAVLKFVFKIEPKDLLENTLVSSIISVIKTFFNLVWSALLLLLDFIKAVLNSAKVFLDGLNH